MNTKEDQVNTETLEPDAEPVAPSAEEALAEAPESLVERLEAAQARYREVVVAASDGDEEAAAQARGLEITIQGLIEEARREALAAELRRRSAIAQREAELREQRERDRVDFSRLLEQREHAFTVARRALAAFAHASQELFAVEGACQDMAGRAEERFLSERDTLSMCVATVGRGLGLSEDYLGWVPARSRSRLLERFPDLLDPGGPAELPDALDSSDSEPPAETVARCSVCGSDSREAIEAALAAGTSYRDVAKEYGVSRSALTRHKSHA